MTDVLIPGPAERGEPEANAAQKIGLQLAELSLCAAGSLHAETSAADSSSAVRRL